MAQFAINGHATRGKEVIELLEMLGGKNVDNYKGNDVSWCYIIKNNEIDWYHKHYACGHFIVFTLEEFLKRFPYKVGDKVIINKNVEIINRMRWTGNEIVYGFTTHNLGELTVNVIQPYKEEIIEDNKIITMEFNANSIRLLTLNSIENLIGRDTIAKLIHKVEFAAKRGSGFVYIKGADCDIEDWYLPIRYFRLKGFDAAQISKEEIKVSWD